eukprot:TRINITY_DN50640_c0_g1_i1.p2 TRINITY_DN50640_c0_g1~~TRINITY_DN50640_c0_g1_i1.p2  ORF type:complete len:214 (+),score=50.95 TRINITY_DN50640_c0_g1_i1:92-733(+)
MPKRFGYAESPRRKHSLRIAPKEAAPGRGPAPDSPRAWHEPHEHTSPRRRHEAHTHRAHHKHNEESGTLDNHNHYWTGSPRASNWRSKINDHSGSHAKGGRQHPSRIGETSEKHHSFEHKGHLSPGRTRINHGNLDMGCRDQAAAPAGPQVRMHATHRSTVADCMRMESSAPPGYVPPTRELHRPRRLRGPVHYVEDGTTDAAEQADIPHTKD